MSNLARIYQAFYTGFNGTPQPTIGQQAGGGEALSLNETGIQTGTVLDSWKLIDQSAVAQAYLNTSINPEPSGAILCGALASLSILRRRRSGR